MIDKLKKENTELKQKKMCVICRINDFEYVIQHCGHLTCDVCSELDICICNAHVPSKHVCILSRTFTSWHELISVKKFVEWLWKMLGSTRSRILIMLLIMCLVHLMSTYKRCSFPIYLHLFVGGPMFYIRYLYLLPHSVV